jgi:hypothetical protein
VEAGEIFLEVGETLKKGFWMVKHLDLSPNFFDASLLIVWLFYDSNKI